ncbi:TrmB family transcriptional regulator [Alteribacillus sp. HJP-4]|uniref:TrmB family transcriptional regulator n=1 Tax=Alteribacillus sp. HJP-4 TaxID=2775394 RepID=UPI0035CCF46B
MKSEVVSALKDLGLTEYEAKIYVSLLRNNPSNGNAIANLSGVPSPKVYESLRKMRDRGLVFTVSGGNKKNQIRYTPLPYEDLLKTKKDSFMNNFQYLNQLLPEISSQKDTGQSEFLVVQGYMSSIETIRSAISESQSEIILSCWRKEFNEVNDLLIKAHNREATIVTLTFDEDELDVPWAGFTHINEEKALELHRGEFSIVIDNKKAIFFDTENYPPHLVVSSHPVMISTTRNYIRHDIYVNRILNDFNEVMTEYYGHDLKDLISDF